MKKLILPFFTFLLILSGFSVKAQQMENIPIIEVIGTASRSTAPDQATFNILLEEKAMNVPTATGVLNTKTKSLADALKKARIKDYKLVADNYSVNVNRVKRGNAMQDSGFVARQSLRVVTTSQNEDLQKISEAIQSAGDMSYQLRFELSEELQKSLENTLITEALRDAQSRARLIAETLGIASIRVHHVTFEQDLQKGIRMMLGDSESSPMLIAPDNQDISKRVYVKYTY
ncbi:SIMPL domain-containing protein [Algoriphagus marincola]|uniref:SIMPL domain-containing protein n=1 Tax=Algoriphagus marincola TaxID=264027 RepID=A0ABS7N0Y4_9BACT|nr:SIMPL domain-containing protein [Algoriphagus marincola]MBY5949959.1 SIMPL domain-containing protein [Algoriphagus marincola]